MFQIMVARELVLVNPLEDGSGWFNVNLLWTSAIIQHIHGLRLLLFHLWSNQRCSSIFRTSSRVSAWWNTFLRHNVWPELVAQVLSLRHSCSLPFFSFPTLRESSYRSCRHCRRRRASSGVMWPGRWPTFQCTFVIHRGSRKRDED